LRPAVVAADLPCPAVRRQREADGKARRYAQGAAISDEDRMKVGAVAPPGVASVVDVAASPSLPGLVILHGRDDVLIDGASLFQTGLGVRGFDDFLRPGFDLVVERHEAVWPQLSGHVRVRPVLLGSERTIFTEQLIDVFPSLDVEAEGHAEAGRLWASHFNAKYLISILRRVKRVRVRGFDAKV